MEFRKYTDFTQMFRRDVTLRMRLDPVTFENGEVKFLEHSSVEIKDEDGKTRLTTNDEEFYQDYKKLKPIIDKYHQYHIQKCLDGFVESVQKDYQDNKEDNFVYLVCSLAELYDKRSENENKEEERTKAIAEIKGKLCANISNFLKDDSKNHYFTKVIKQEGKPDKEFGYSQLFSKDFLISELVEFAKGTDILSSDEIAHVNHIIEQATRMTQYCDKLFTSRKNVYGMKKNSVAYRCVHENMFRFFSICKKAKKVCEVLGKEEYLGEYFSPDMYCYYLSQAGIDKFNAVVSSLNSSINQHNQNLVSKEMKEKKLYKLKPLYKQILSDREAVIDVIANDLELEDKLESIVGTLGELGLIGAEDNIVKTLLENLRKHNLSQIYLSANNLFPVSAALLNDGMKLKNMVEWKKDNTPKRKVVSIQEIIQYIQIDLESDIDVCTYFNNLKAKDVQKEKYENIFDLIQMRFKAYSDSDSETFKGERKTAFKRLMDVVVSLNHSLKSLSCPDDYSERDEAFYEEYDKIIEKLRDIDHSYNLVRNYVLQNNNREEQFPLYFGEDAKEFLNGFTVADDGHGTRHRGYLFRKEVSHIGNEVLYDYYIGVANYHHFFPRRNASNKRNEDSELQHLIYYQTTQDTFKKQFTIANGKNESISLSDTSLRDWVIEYLKSTLGRGAITFIYKEGKDELNAASSSLKGVMQLVQVNIPKTYEAVLKCREFKKRDKKFVEQLVNAAQSIDRIKEFVDYNPKGKHSWEVKEDLINMVDTCSSKYYEYVSVKDLQEAVNGIVKSGENRHMYFFRISNKDLNYFVPNKRLIGKIQRKDEPLRKSHGRENLHTMFFRSMMNENESVFDLGAGKIMYRRASLEKKETHKLDETTKLSILRNKNEMNPKKESTFKYSLYKDKRFTRDQMTLHLSMTQNYKVPDEKDVLKRLNESVRKYLAETAEKFNIIGIDRGERNLLYVTLMKPNGTIIRQKSLNIITDEQHNLSTDYHQLLKDKADKIKQQKADWDEIDKISTLKEGYLSQAVHEIAKMAVDNKAIIVMEKLSEGFKSARQKYLSSVYQLFERMLVRKLSFYTDKTLDKNAPGGILNALQLTAMDSVDLNKNDDNVVQNGIIFFVPAWMTSKIDPVTGFANLFTFGGIKTLTEAKKLLSKFSAIGYDKKKKEFVFSFDYSDFGVTIDSINKWTIGTHGDRIVFYHDVNGYPSRKHIVLTDEFMTFFEKYDVEVSEDMRDKICTYNVAEHQSISEDLKELGNKGFFEEFLRNICCIVQLRNSDPDAKEEKDKDYIISPVVKADGKYYLSSDYLKVDSPEKQEKAKLPVDSDANGAYNIARKGILVLEQIKKQKKTIKISEKEWLAFAQKSYKDSLK